MKAAALKGLRACKDGIGWEAGRSECSPNTYLFEFVPVTDPEIDRQVQSNRLPDHGQ
ncbi:hypothetical protein SPHINGOR109_20096 [Sphingorhabdus sp. 109]|jgi:hypothetical protein|nr:hypothetical protein SPHINGOR109_20096 [Sphingorhabdus sp. 109]